MRRDLSPRPPLEVVMTPLRPSEKGSQCIRVERLPWTKLDERRVQHIAGGPYKGIIVNKAGSERMETSSPHTQRHFTAYVKSPNSKDNALKERRRLRFWFNRDAPRIEKLADQFVNELLNPKAFPKDYIGFVKRLLNLLRTDLYIQKLELEMRPVRPGEDDEVYVLRTRVVKRTYVAPTSGQEDFRRITEGSTAAPVELTANGRATENSCRTPPGTLHLRHHPRDPSDPYNRRSKEINRRSKASPVGSPDSLVMTPESRTSSRDSYLYSSSSRSKSPGSRNSSHSSMPRSPSDQESGIVADRSRLSYASLSSTSPTSPTGGSYKDSMYAKTRDKRLSSGRESETTPFVSKDRSSATSAYTRASFGTTFGKESANVNNDKRIETKTVITTSTRYGSSPGKDGKIKLTRRGQELIWITKKQRILTTLEDAFPNTLQIQDLISRSGFKKKDMVPVAVMLRDLVKRGLIQEMEKGRWLRVQKSIPTPTDKLGQKRTWKRHDIRMVQTMPHLAPREQPVVAIVTRLYCEKLAVDSMIDNKVTYVRYKTEGEGQVYTTGTIGKLKVVSTKLARIGYEQGATTSSGNTITRLLGIFGKVEYVIMVGVGGSIPGRHNNTVEVGHVVVSQPDHQGGPLYVQCTGMESDTRGNEKFNTTGWVTRNDTLNNIVSKLKSSVTNNTSRPWDQYRKEGMEELEGGEVRFYKPWSAADSVDADAIRVHHGVIGSGQMLSKHELMRRDFALSNDVLAVDAGYHAVLDAVEGSRKDCFLIIRGITDFKDGMAKRDWQPYASLAAASYMKAVVLALS